MTQNKRIQLPYSFIMANLEEEKNSDGLCICHACGQLHLLYHWSASHPFDYLRCESCHHMLCEQCPISAVLTLVESHGNKRPRTAKQVPFLSVCKGCGLSHRATETANGTVEFSAASCQSGEDAQGNLKYRITLRSGENLQAVAERLTALLQANGAGGN